MPSAGTGKSISGLRWTSMTTSFDSWLKATLAPVRRRTLNGKRSLSPSWMAEPNLTGLSPRVDT